MKTFKRAQSNTIRKSPERNTPRIWTTKFASNRDGELNASITDNPENRTPFMHSE